MEAGFTAFDLVVDCALAFELINTIAQSARRMPRGGRANALYLQHVVAANSARHVATGNTCRAARHARDTREVTDGHEKRLLVDPDPAGRLAESPAATEAEPARSAARTR
jgi:hypothetical protein